MKEENNKEQSLKVNRRDFMKTSLAAGAGLMVGQTAFSQTNESAKDGELNIALIGSGSQGRNLLNNCLKIDCFRMG